MRYSGHDNLKAMERAEEIAAEEHGVKVIDCPGGLKGCTGEETAVRDRAGRIECCLCGATWSAASEEEEEGLEAELLALLDDEERERMDREEARAEAAELLDAPLSILELELEAILAGGAL